MKRPTPTSATLKRSWITSLVMMLTVFLANATQAQTTAHFGIDPGVSCCYCIDYQIRSGCAGTITGGQNGVAVCDTHDIPLAAGEVIHALRVYLPNCSTLLWSWTCNGGGSGSPTCGGAQVNFEGDMTTGFRVY